MGPSIEQPDLSVFVKPYFFFANRIASEITSASSSITDVLGYSLHQVLGIPYQHLLLPDCPLNKDGASETTGQTAPRQTFHSLRSMRDQTGEKRILSIRTVAIPAEEGRPYACHHSIAEDVTESVKHHARLMHRRRDMLAAEERMTKQEREIADRILQGKMSREIADELTLSERTIDRRRARIMGLFGVNTGFALVSKLAQSNELKACIDLEQTADWYRSSNRENALPSVKWTANDLNF